MKKIVSLISTFFWQLWQGVLGIFRNSVMSIGSVLALVSCMVLLGTFYSILDLININFSLIDDMNVMIVNLPETNETQAQQIVDAVMSLKDREGYEYIENIEHLTKADNWYHLLEMYQDADSNTLEILNKYFDAQNNPLPESVRITFTSFSDMTKLYSLRYTLGSLEYTAVDGRVLHIGEENVLDKLETYENITKVKNAVTVTGIWVLAILLLVTVFIIINTLKLGIHARRNEIFFMRYCGATKAFIRMPFVIEGLILGAVSALLAFGLQRYVYVSVIAKIFNDYSMGTVPEFSTYAIRLLAAFGAIGLVTGMIGTMISIKRYLKA